MKAVLGAFELLPNEQLSLGNIRAEYWQTSGIAEYVNLAEKLSGSLPNASIQPWDVSAARIVPSISTRHDVAVALGLTPCRAGNSKRT